VSTTGGRPENGRPPLRFRLKRSIEVFPTPDGAIQFGHDGFGRYFRVESPDESDTALLDLLGAGFATAPELEDGVRSRGLDPSGVVPSLGELRKIGLIETSRGLPLLAPQRAERFDRQLIYLADLSETEEAEALQLRLARSRVVVLGCGGLGSWTACGLACAGVGEIVLVDHDTIELSNLNRQILFSEGDLGRPKTTVAAAALKAIDSELRVETHRRRVDSAPEITELIGGADLLVGTADWAPHLLPRWINEASLETGVPYITAGQFPPLIRIGPMVLPGRSSCLGCQELEAESEYPLYGELAGYRSRNPSTASTLGAASGMIGSMLAMEALHQLTGAAAPASINRALIMDLRSMTTEPEEVLPHPDCVCGAAARAA